MSITYYTKFDSIRLPFYQGDTEQYIFTCYDDEDLATASVLTGYTITAQARLTPEAPDVLWDTTSTSGMAIADGSNGSNYAIGKVVLLIPSAVTSKLPPRFVFDIKATSGSTTKRIANGVMTMIGAVTR